MIKCALRAREEYHHVLPGYTTKTRFGLYHGSDFHFPHFGTKKWVVGVYIDVDYDKHVAEGIELEEVIRGCIEYLNQPPPRKKYQKKKPQPLYGNLDSEPLQFWTGEDSEGKYIGALLITDQRKNKNFWGAGGVGRIKRKRGRPRKDEQ
jgi:hypothetical protein